MIRLALRQFRSQTVVAAALLAGIAVVVVVTGPALGHLYDTTVATCTAGVGDCRAVEASFLGMYGPLQLGLSAILLGLPALLGIFWGAPLIAREFETGTFRLAWTQSVTRTHWLGVKLGLVALSGMVVAGLLSLMVTWWFSPIDRVSVNQFQPTMFYARNIVPVALVAFAVVLGITSGLVMRRTLPAMAMTLAGVICAMLAVTYVVGPNLIPPAHASMPISAAPDLGFVPGPALVAGTPDIPNAWVLSSRIVDSSGQVPSQAILAQFIGTACPKVLDPLPAPLASEPNKAPAATNFYQACVEQLSSKYHEDVTYQPADRYWAFQWLEAAIFMGLVVILAGVSFWKIRRSA